MDNAAVTPVDRVTRLLMPLVGATRSGADVRLGDHFDRIHAEIAKLARPSGAEEVDWKSVVSRAETVLVGESKDLQVAVYLALAWYRQEGLVGLSRGLELLGGLIGSRWDELFPPLDKPAARADVLTWLSDRLRTDLAATLQRGEPTEARGVWQAFARLRDLTRTRFPDRGPALGPIEQAFASLPPALAAEVFGTAEPEPAPVVAPNAAVTGGNPILAPVAGEDPTGADPWLCDDFEALRGEITKLGAVAGGEAAWPKILGLSQKILVERGKDLRCLCYWVVARVRIDGAKGLTEGFATLLEAASFGDKLHPRRSKARAGALTWLGERLQAELVKQPPAPTADELAAVRAAIVACKAAFDPMCDGTSGLTIADEALARLKTKPAVKAPAARPVAPVAGAPTPSAAPPAAAALEGLDDVATFLLEQAAGRVSGGKQDAGSLRLRRLALWMVPPAAGASKKLECDVGTAAQRNELAALATAENWSELLHNCELLVLQFPWWIDLTYFSALAAEHVLGKDAARALRGELCALALRHPGLLSSFDRKGQWLASKDVRDWFARELTPRPPEAVASAPSSGAGPGAPTPTPDAVPAAKPAEAPASGEHEVPAEITELLKAKKPEEATGRAATWIAAATGARGRFSRNLALAQACLAANEVKLALPMFRALEGQLRKLTIEQWDPTIVAGCLRGYLVCRQGLGLGTDERLLDELVLLDPRAMTGLVR